MRKHIYAAEYCYNEKIYFTKNNGGDKLWVIPFPNDSMAQMLTPGEVDLSDPQHPNIEMGGKITFIPDKADDYDYSKFEAVEIWLGNDTVICEGSSFILDAPEEFLTYYWQDGSLSPRFQVTQTGEYWIEVMDQHGCYSRDTIGITFLPSPTVNLGNDTTLGSGQSLILDAGSGMDGYLWQDGSVSQTFEALESGAYWVTVSKNGCTGSDTILVTVVNCIASLYIGNCFTPNGDGHNDTFKPVSQNLSTFEMIIFNRWGRVLFTGYDPGVGWNGKMNGIPCPVGTYFYLIRYTTPCTAGMEREGIRKGAFTLLE